MTDEFISVKTALIKSFYWILCGKISDKGVFLIVVIVSKIIVGALGQFFVINIDIESGFSAGIFVLTIVYKHRSIGSSTQIGFQLYF